MKRDKTNLYDARQYDGKWCACSCPERDGRFDNWQAARDEAKRLNAAIAPSAIPVTPVESPFDFDSGFGIGGISSSASLDQLAYGESKMLIEQLGKPPRPKRKHSGTRYEENCEICGRFSFEICNTCGGCARCCPGES